MDFSWFFEDWEDLVSIGIYALISFFLTFLTLHYYTKKRPLNIITYLITFLTFYINFFMVVLLPIDVASVCIFFQKIKKIPKSDFFKFLSKITFCQKIKFCQISFKNFKKQGIVDSAHFSHDDTKGRTAYTYMYVLWSLVYWSIQIH